MLTRIYWVQLGAVKALPEVSLLIYRQLALNLASGSDFNKMLDHGFSSLDRKIPESALATLQLLPFITSMTQRVICPDRFYQDMTNCTTQPIDLCKVY